VSRSEAKALVDSYFETYPKVKSFMQRSVDAARDKGYIETEFGRRRYLPDISSHNSVVRGFAERNAVNAPIQGTAADVIKVAMVAIDRCFEQEGLRSKMILQVHDELNFSVVPEEMERVKEIVIREMEAAFEMQVPLLADCGVGANWLEAH
jgi:DNA polymerase-1